MFSTMNKKRCDMVKQQLIKREITDLKVLQAMEKVPRHMFIPKDLQNQAYEDHPLPIGNGQTISQPFIVAYMTQILRQNLNCTKNQKSKILEIGTGCGYQTCILAEIADEVYTIEIIDQLANSAQNLFINLKYRNIFNKTGDGCRGWPEKSPFDGIMLTAAIEQIPKELLEQVKVGGCLLAPIGKKDEIQNLTLKKRIKSNEWCSEELCAVRFVSICRSH